MAVTAVSDTEPAVSATAGGRATTSEPIAPLASIGSAFTVEVGGGSGVRAGTYPFEVDELVTDWHRHTWHQLEYAIRGTVEVETAGVRHLLPPQQAVWIPAGLEHQTTIRRVQTVSVFFAPDLVSEPGDRTRVLAAVPVMREMIRYATRWPVDRPADDPTAAAFFVALAALVGEWIEHESPLFVPTSDDPVVAAAMAFTRDHLDEATAAGVAAAVGVSERTLRRRFAAEAGMTWRRFLVQSRLLAAMALLADPEPTVLSVSTAVGFDSVSAFGRAFRDWLGETPSGYRARILSRAP